ncbi:TraR/DksA family transcriptional regulator [Flavihumibacter stibioxidans]|nr:TraR/DksA C4-type zinc finger protein [Flavihumibacter stibioxidans]
MATNKKASASAKTKAGGTAKASATAAKKVAPAKHTASAKPAPAPAKKAAAKPVAKKAATPDKKTASKAAPAPARSAKPIKPAAKASKAAVPPSKAGKAVAPVKKADVPAPKKAAPAPSKPVIKKEEPAKRVAEVKAAPAKTSANGGKAAAGKSAPVKTIKAVSKSVTARPAVVKDDSKQTTPIPIKKPAPPPEKRPSKVVMPEIKTKTVKPYNPDFTKSVLDQDNPIPSGPTMRYSDGELVEFKELINKKLDAAKKELAYLQGLITRKDEMGGDESESRYMTMEDGSVSMEREQLAQMASRQITFIDHLEKALMRIENKTYGICRVTGKLIDKARLRAVPHATLSIEAKNTMNK